MPEYINSSFKVQAARVRTTLGTVPEEGAIVFHGFLKQLFYADGFNWLPLQQEIDTVAVRYITEQLYELTGGVDVPLSFIEEVLYNIGDSFTVSEPGQSITILKSGDYQVNVSADLKSNNNNSSVHTAAVIDGVAQPGSDTLLPRRRVWETVTQSYPLTFLANEVLTAEIGTIGNDDISVRNFTLGLQAII